MEQSQPNARRRVRENDEEGNTHAGFDSHPHGFEFCLALCMFRMRRSGQSGRLQSPTPVLGVLAVHLSFQRVARELGRSRFRCPPSQQYLVGVHCMDVDYKGKNMEGTTTRSWITRALGVRIHNANVGPENENEKEQTHLVGARKLLSR